MINLKFNLVHYFKNPTNIKELERMEYICDKIIPTMSKHGIYYYTYYYVCDNIGDILLHDCVVKSTLWLMPLIIILFIVIFAINHVTFNTTMTFITIVGKYN